MVFLLALKLLKLAVLIPSQMARRDIWVQQENGKQLLII